MSNLIKVKQINSGTNGQVLTTSGGETVWANNSAPSKFVTTSAFTDSVSITITHGLGTEDILVNLWEDSPKRRTDGEVIVIDSNNVQITMGQDATFKVVVIG